MTTPKIRPRLVIEEDYYGFYSSTVLGITTVVSIPMIEKPPSSMVPGSYSVIASETAELC